MKKTIIGLFIAMFWIGSASADAGVNIGVSGTAALFGATATEEDIGDNVTEKNTESEIMGAGYASVFVEKELGSFFVGVDYVLSDLETEENTSLRNDCTTQACGAGDTFTQVTQKVKVTFSDLATAYVGVKIGESFYAKAGIVNVDLTTNETLGTGSTYGNTSMDGTMVGVGGQADLPNGMFIRGEGTYMDFDGASLTSSTGVNVVKVNGVDGVTAKLSIGKTF